MAQIEGGHVDDRVGAVPGPDSVNRRVTGPGTEPGSVPGLVRLKWAMCKRGLREHLITTTELWIMTELCDLTLPSCENICISGIRCRPSVTTCTCYN